MSLNRIYALSGTQPRILATLGIPRPTFSDVIRTPLRLPFGSTVTILETITIRLTLTQPELVDVDMQWFAPKYYLGAWELIEDVPTNVGTVAEYPKAIDGYGFISSFNQQIRFQQDYLVRGRSDSFPFPNGVLELNQCNFVLIPRSPSVDPLLPPGFEPGIDEGVFKGNWSNEELPIEDSVIVSRGESLGIYVKPGTQLDSITHNLKMAGQANLAVPQSILTTCLLGSSCSTEFNAFVLSINEGFPIDSDTTGRSFGVFSSNSPECNSTGAGNCFMSTYTCANGETRSYWTPIAT